MYNARVKEIWQRHHVLCCAVVSRKSGAPCEQQQKELGGLLSLLLSLFFLLLFFLVPVSSCFPNVSCAYCSTCPQYCSIVITPWPCDLSQDQFSRAQGARGGGAGHAGEQDVAQRRALPRSLCFQVAGARTRGQKRGDSVISLPQALGPGRGSVPS